MQLSEQEKNSLEHWVDGVAVHGGMRSKVPMHVRYSDCRLEESGNVKRLLLALLHKGRELEEAAVHAQLACLLPHVDRQKAKVRSDLWGPMVLRRQQQRSRRGAQW